MFQRAFNGFSPAHNFFSLSRNQLTKREFASAQEKFFRTKNEPKAEMKKSPTKNEVSIQLVMEDNKNSVKIWFFLRPVHL